MKTQTKKINKLLVTCIAAIIAICFVAIVPMFAHADDPADTGETTPSIEWSSVNYVDYVSVPKDAGITFSYTFTYTLITTDSKTSAEKTYTDQWTVSNTTEGYVDGDDGYRTWKSARAFSNFKDVDGMTPNFSSKGKHSAILIRTINPGPGVADNLTSRGAMNRKDLSVDSSAAANYEKYSLTIYAGAEQTTNGGSSTVQPSHVIVWDTLAHSEETESHKTIAKYGGYYAMPAGNLTITRNAPRSSFASTDALTYKIKFYDLSRRDKTCEALTVPATWTKADGTTANVNIVFNANSPEGVIENGGTIALKPNEKLVIESGKLNSGTTYDIICRDVKEGHFHAASASSTLTGASYSYTPWPLNGPLYIIYGEQLPTPTTEEKDIINNVTVVGATDGSYANLVFDCQTVTPTGFMINNSPYIALILIPAGLICAWFVYRRKKNISRA